ncbi:hypothetical protein ABVK25_007175 [Lepraria finkii]|uniref:Flagellar FliJ protein n=1 Tax=Lepraria finkii TaxID=1340010 RepID=A0ABR4B4C9_9LECA
MADLRVRYSGVTKALRPALKELAARTVQNLRDDDHYHLSGRNRQHYNRFKAQWDANLHEEIARINAITTMKMENEAAKTGYAQQEVGDAYGRKIEGIRADRMVDIELEQTVFQIEHGLRGERSGASGGEVERRRGQKHGMRS